MRKMNDKGFTLIELLVVIAIIGMLSTLAVVALNSARAKSRDGKRVADVKQLQTALELYYADNNDYPSKAGTADCTSSAKCTLGTGADAKALCGAGGTTTAGLRASCGTGETVYMAKVPSAPTPADGGCDATTGNPYLYWYTSATQSYSLSFCIGGVTGDLAKGAHTASPAGVQ